MGVNTPASAVVIVGLEHPGPHPYSVAEYKNLAGRAGRFGYAEHGASFLVAQDGRAEHDYWHRYVTAQPEDLASRFLDADVRTLIMRVLVSAQRAGGMTGEDVVQFLESSFGAFQEAQRADGWRWDAASLTAALQELARHRMIEEGQGGRYTVTPLGRLAGESAIEIESVIRVVDCLTSLHPGEISDPTLLAVAQATTELDAVHFPINKRSTQKEPQTWANELRQQGVAPTALMNLQRNVTDHVRATLRAKKAVACLYYVSNTEMGEIERVMTRFGGSFDGAAGPIRSVASRTSDVLPLVARVAELLHTGLDLADRIGRLVIRLEHGIAPENIELARDAGRDLGRGDYRRLSAAGLTAAEPIERASDDEVLACINNDSQKLRIVRLYAERVRAQSAIEAKPLTTLEPYRA
jgi:helicase